MIIYDINEVELANLGLQEPIRIQGGAYFSKVLYNNEELYINTPKSNSKNGIIKTGKRMYIDLLYDETNSEIINWILDLEKTIKQKIFEKTSLWFHNDMDLDDIDYYYNSCLRTYRGNKYLLRCNVINKTTFNNKQTIQIFDENENIKEVSDVKDNSLLSIAQISGIRFTNNSFHLEIMIKQLMILDKRDLFNNCLIKKDRPKKDVHLERSLDNSTLEEKDIGTIIPDDHLSDEDEDEQVQNEIVNLDDEDEQSQQSQQSQKDDEDDEDQQSQQSQKDHEEDDEDDEDQQSQKDDGDQQDDEDEDQQDEDNEDKISINESNKDVNDEPKDLGILSNDNPQDLEEYSIDINELDIVKNDNPIVLKKPNEVYYEIYRQARQKARNAKKAAIIAYLEAKNIKNTYMLENVDDSSDEEFDIEDLEQNLNGE